MNIHDRECTKLRSDENLKQYNIYLNVYIYIERERVFNYPTGDLC